jgi:hypothetical protein
MAAEQSIWCMTVKWADEYGSSSVVTRYTTYHPFKRVADMKEEAEGHINYVLVSWQKLTDEDIEVFYELDMQADTEESTE